MSSDDLKPGDRFQDYIIKGCLGQGGMGTVYEAVEEFSGSAVAIKCLRGDFTGREDFILRLKQESKFYSKLRHPNIVRMNRAGITLDGRVFIVMERLIGRTLRSILDHTSRLDFLNSLHVLLQIAEAIGAAHEAGIWHRDLKPENVMVGTRGGERGHVWVLDFGIATDGAANTDEMPRLGTFRYLSTEQVCGLKPDGRADIYAFGIIAYEMLTGRHTFLGTRTDATAAEIASGHLNAAAPKPVHELVPGCPEALWPILQRCLEKDREQRYGTFDAVVDDLRALIHSSVPPEHLLARREQQESLATARRTAFDSLHEAGAEATKAEPEPARAARLGNHGTEPLVSFAAPARVKHLATEPLVGFAAPDSVLPFTSGEARARPGEERTEETPKTPAAVAPLAFASTAPVTPQELAPTAKLALAAPEAERASPVARAESAPARRRSRLSFLTAPSSWLALILAAIAGVLTARALRRETPSASASVPTAIEASTATVTTTTEIAAVQPSPAAMMTATAAIVAVPPAATASAGMTQKPAQTPRRKSAPKPAASEGGASISVLLVPTFELKESSAPKRRP